MSPSVVPPPARSLSPALTGPAAPARTCPSCETAAIGAFCHACGARVDVRRLTLRALGAEVLAQVIELDHGVLHTIVALVRRPGQTIRGYFAGRRRGLTSPLAFVALSVAASLLATSTLPVYRAGRDAKFQALETYRPFYSPAQFDLFSRIERGASDSKAVMLLLLLIPTTLALRFLFRKQRLNLAETGAIVCYFYGVASFVSLAVAVPFVLAGWPAVETPLTLLIDAAFILHIGFGVFGRSFRTTWRMLWGWFVGMLGMQGLLVLVPYFLAR